MEAVRGDGASVLAALAILSENKAYIRFALTQGPTRLDGQDTLDVCPFVQRLALAFFDPARIFAWLRGGAAPSALVAEIGVLLLSADLGAAVTSSRTCAPSPAITKTCWGTVPAGRCRRLSSWWRS